MEWKQIREVVAFFSGLTNCVAWPVAIIWLDSILPIPEWMGKILMVAAVLLSLWFFIKLQQLVRDADRADYLEKKLNKK